MNKYEQKPDYVLDLHGYTVIEAAIVLNELLDEKKYSHVRIITGKGMHSKNGPILKDFVKDFLNTNNIRFNQAKIQYGGEGALEVFL